MLISSRDAECSMILVMGVTGSGKSYFINRLAHGAVAEGHKLHSSKTIVFFLYICNRLNGAETAECQVVRARIGRQEVALVDTPGFDDTTRSDAEILEQIVQFLCTQYELGIPLKGIIYMHRITDNRMSGSAQRYFEMFMRLCGDQNLENVVLLTTMWGEMKDEGKGLQRERELRREFWKDMEKNGSTIRRFDGSRSMAEAFVCRLMRKDDIILDIQDELVGQGKRLEQTKAGQLVVPMIDQRIGESERKIREMEEEERAPNSAEAQRRRRVLIEQHKKNLDQRRRLQVKTGEEVKDKIAGERKRDKMKSSLQVFVSILGLVATATVNVILPLAGVSF
ncbi:P-loop containing nucleoside triphosphate hydrolase protein [Phaeosphaeria sp. MPI-PUGE-AT-0046c]|nr:P-loop containing nucleoside triphosphate hydrolase protein [Phaeosphaeria sp. MPI-PUGE-AT-0046c]